MQPAAQEGTSLALCLPLCLQIHPEATNRNGGTGSCKEMTGGAPGGKGGARVGWGRDSIWGQEPHSMPSLCTLGSLWGLPVPPWSDKLSGPWIVQ